MPQHHDFSSSEQILKDTFKQAQLIQVENFVNSILETESFSEFSRYTKDVISMYFKAFLYRLTSLVWMHYADYDSDIEEFFKPMTNAMAKQVATIKKELIQKNIVKDVMSEQQIRSNIANFFYEYENKSEFKKIQKNYLVIRQQFDKIIDLTNSFQTCGEHLVRNASDLMALYLQYKEAIFKGMGFDVVLEYFSVDNFKLIYRDERLRDLEEREQYERIVMNAALKAAMPGFDGDISVFEDIVRDL